MNSKELFEQIKQKRSFLCVGLDTDLGRIPEILLSKEDPIFEFNKAIIDATADYAIAYKANLAFYEINGASGWNSLQKTIKYIRTNHPDIFTIADAKRGDIANTSRMYARAFYHHLDFHAITLSPYMGQDTVDPFLTFEKKWVILLALTSNTSFDDFQMEVNGETKKLLYETVIEKSMHWGTENNMMYVVGATRAKMLEDVRKIIPDHFLLVPGVGEQGGSLADVAKYGMNKQCGLLVNSSRGILYADNSMRFADAARAKAMQLQKQMKTLLDEANLI
ncbi:MAG: orotidine-5'-phosphate decarboxylase [Bacteroidales bacterium]|nr:orotidine-5'-phosphate decarboxylase [Bacteroidales bacterium]MDD3890899.1 orotidine-5'-phosphate decarboxylase [Bacteroidales bacterium]